MNMWPGKRYWNRWFKKLFSLMVSAKFIFFASISALATILLCCSKIKSAEWAGIMGTMVTVVLGARVAQQVGLGIADALRDRVRRSSLDLDLESELHTDEEGI